MSKKILIAYASGFGTTQEIALDIGKVLTELGLDVNVLAVSDVQDLSSYDGVVLGASIRSGNLLPQALDFARKIKRRSGNSVRRVCRLPDHAERHARNRRIVLCWTNPLRDIVEPFDVGLFAGKLILKEFPFPDPILKELMAQGASEPDWDKIRSWARGLVPVLSGAEAGRQPGRPEGC